jgi:hypothetical protein
MTKNIKILALSCLTVLINNIPEHIDDLYIDFYHYNKDNKNVDNLPLTIKRIFIENEKHKNFIKIPFGCVLTIKKFATN